MIENQVTNRLAQILNSVSVIISTSHADHILTKARKAYSELGIFWLLVNNETVSRKSSFMTQF